MLHDLNELVNPGLTSHLQEGHMETEPRSKASSERQEKRGGRYCDPWIGSLACYPLHHHHSYMTPSQVLHEFRK